MPKQRFPTAIVGANPLLHESLSRFLQKSAFNVDALASCKDEFTPAAPPQDRATLLIIDSCDHPGDVCVQIERFRQDHPSGRIVVLANHYEPAEMALVLRPGANGCFATISICDDFIKSLELVMGDQTVLPSEALESVLVGGTSGATDVSMHCDAALAEMPGSIGSVEVRQLSVRELYILRRLTEGSSNKVKVKNRTQAAIWGLNNRTLVWRRPDDPCRDPAAKRPTINITLGTHKIDTARSEAAGQVEQNVNIRAHSIRCVAGTDDTTEAG